MKKTLAVFLSSLLILPCFLRYRGRVRFGKGVVLNWRFRFRGPGRLEIGDGCNLWAHQEPNAFHTYGKDSVIRIGKNCRLNGVSVHCRKAVTFGGDCLAGSAILMDNDFHSVEFDHRNDPAYIKSKPIVIEDRAWLAGQSAILKGVTVGKDAVVAFRAVVTKDVPEGRIVAGNPAEIVR
jgi:acetyltransferase-like isoleucine patch superfamily enzyme